MARGGSNLSVGQRQIIALARAMVRESKLLILDEGSFFSLPNSTPETICVLTGCGPAATSAIDYKTDAVIQESLRTELKKDVTVITIAHRLQTIMDADKIVGFPRRHVPIFSTYRRSSSLPCLSFAIIADGPRRWEDRKRFELTISSCSTHFVYRVFQ